MSTSSLFLKPFYILSSEIIWNGDHVLDYTARFQKPPYDLNAWDMQLYWSAKQTNKSLEREERKETRRQSEGQESEGNGKCKERENLQQQCSEQPACDQHLNHSWRLTPSTPEEVNCSHSPCEHSSKHEPSRERASVAFHTYTQTPCIETHVTVRLQLLAATVN